MAKKINVVESTIGPAVDFINKIEAGDKVVIAHGHDNDSICSAAVLYRLLKKFKGVDAELFSTKDNFALRDEDVDEIAKADPNHIIVVDIAHVTFSSHVVDTLSSNSSLVIDHHQPIKIPGVTYCNPREFEKKIYMPVSYIVYRIYEKFGDAGDVAWVAGVGVLSDHAVAIAGDLFEKIKKVEPRLIGETNLKEEDLYSYSVIGALAKIFDSARVVEGRVGSVLAARTLVKAKSYQEILNASGGDAAKLMAWSDLVRKEFKRLVADFNKKRKLVKGNIIFYEIPSKLFIKSSLSGYLSQFFADKVLVVAQKSDGRLDVSFRRGEKLKTDLNKMAKRAIAGIPDSEGGGHEAASGARIPVKYLSKFLKQL